MILGGIIFVRDIFLHLYSDSSCYTLSQIQRQKPVKNADPTFLSDIPSITYIVNEGVLIIEVLKLFVY